MKATKGQNNVTQKNKTGNKNQNKAQRQSVESDEENYAINPPNGRWGWIVVLSALYCNIVVDGIQLTFGIFLNPISKSFNAPFSEVSLAGSLMFGLHLLMGPLCAGCNNAFGLRPVTITGSLICCFGVGISYFSKGYVFLCFSFGIIGGVGLGLVYMNTLVITSLYFTTLLPIAVGIVVCGSGLGTMIFAGLGSVLLKITTWQNSFLMQAVLAGSMGLAAIVFRPLKPIKVNLTQPGSEDRTAGPSSARKNSVFVKTDVSLSSIISTATLQDVAWGFAQKMAVKDLEKKKKRKCACLKCFKERKTTPESEISIISLSEISQDTNAYRKLYTEKKAKQNLEAEENRESLVSLKPVYKKFDIEKKSAKDKIWTPIKQTLVTMLECNLLRSLSFFLFTLSGAVQVAALLIVFIYEKDRTEDLGFADNMSVIFIVALGGTNVFWRLVLGTLAAFAKVNYKLLLILGNIVGGIATFSSGFISNIYYEFIFCLFFSLSMATGAVFRVVLLVELVGIDKIATATGINLLFMGAFCIIFPPIFGLIMEATKSYQILFSITGGLILISGLLLIGVRKVEVKENRKNAAVEKS